MSDIQTLEDVLFVVDRIGMVEHDGSIEYIYNVVLHIDDGIGDGDTWRVLDYLVFDWEWGKSFDEQSKHYTEFVRALINKQREDIDYDPMALV